MVEKGGWDVQGRVGVKAWLVVVVGMENGLLEK